MGTIRSTKGAQRQLAECTVIGRANTCDIRVRAAEASTEHAALRWTKHRWHVVDLGSRNGTWVNGRRLQGGEPVGLDEGDLLCLGTVAEAWLLEDGAPPLAFLRSATGDRTVNQGMIALPSDDEPRLVIMQRSDGGWIAEEDGEQRAMEDREFVSVAGARWRVYLPSHAPPTAAATGSVFCVEDAELHVRHDGTEEFVVVEFKPRSGPGMDLGVRAHNAVLLELARARLEDRERGIVEAEEGWIHCEDLSRRLNLPATHVNIMIHRLRKQLAECGVVDATDVVQRRARSGLMRIGMRSVSVARIV
jgi:hypothetical protein